MPKNKFFRLCFIIMILLVALACGVSFGGDDDEAEALRTQLTQQSMQMTQAAMDAAQKQPAQDADSDSQQDASDDSSSSSSSDDDEADDDCYAIKFLSETIPDGSKFLPGEKFTKTWTIRNNGDCEWTKDFSLDFNTGDRMSGASSTKLGKTVDPGESITLSVDLTAPDKAGDYTARWHVSTEKGAKVGWISVKITVGPKAPPPAAFAVTSVAFSAGAQPIVLVCPACFTVTAQVQVSAAGTVKFKWTDCEGATESGTLTFDAAGTKPITHNICVNPPDGPHWADLYIEQPNNQTFASQDFQVDCNP